MFEYASSPMNFNQNADRIIHRVFSSSRYLYENKSADTERYADGAEILIGRLPSVVGAFFTSFFAVSSILQLKHDYSWFLVCLFRLNCDM